MRPWRWKIELAFEASSIAVAVVLFTVAAELGPTSFGLIIAGAAFLETLHAMVSVARVMRVRP